MSTAQGFSITKEETKVGYIDNIKRNKKGFKQPERAALENAANSAETESKIFSEFMVDPSIIEAENPTQSSEESYFHEEGPEEPSYIEEPMVDDENTVDAEDVFRDVLEEGNNDMPSEKPVMVPKKFRKLGVKGNVKGKGLDSLLSTAKLDEEPSAYYDVPFDEEEEPEEKNTSVPLAEVASKEDPVKIEAKPSAASVPFPMISLDEGVQEIRFKLGIYEISGFLKVEKKYDN